MAETRDIGVLGGGVAGLALSALLAARGHHVTVYELGRAGGKLRRIQVGGLTFDTGPSLFTFPEVWQTYLARLHEADPLALTPLPGGFGVHHTPFGALPLPVPPDHLLYAEWQRYVEAAAPLRPHLTALLTTPPRLRDPVFRTASHSLFRVTAPHLSAQQWLRSRSLPARLLHALSTHALNAGLAPQDAPALYALIPALVGHDVFRPTAGMGALLDHLVAFGRARGVCLREDTPVARVRKQAVTLGGGETAHHDLLISAMDPARLAVLRGEKMRSPVARRTVGGLAVYAALPAPAPWPATSVVPPSNFGAFRRAVRAGALPPDTLSLIHADGPRLAILLTVPAMGEDLTPEHPWVQAQLARVERTLGSPGVLKTVLDMRALSPAHYALGGHPGGALYGAALAPWRGGPLHPQPYRLKDRLWQVGTGVHPGGGLPAVLGGVLMVDRLLQERGI
ncbi:NAD(P)/FAD-dependent oxidoreductase [Deinococcus deserti]|uniref:Putative Phytoene dehydrogenase putative Flavin containing amine oxidoreductase n=1 Tax=Deinococcus deserti (strain DSM 17065 / CIP 109153 / LMG 22923 / VCD115) TaxID=546414 RepID=C1CVW1_DEIDV|nr:NAD(P)/FAD-dependent oxidoreductase [Deinococcus deserti]ACO46328.1 putative Phytoene dehydrogenase; putative Flavin containing amine oxidoreductase [Deinococcus deserti VCD115]